MAERAAGPGPVGHPGQLADDAPAHGVAEGVVVGTGVANVWSRDATTAAAASVALADAFPERFLLGLGISHAPVVASRGHDYTRPLATMRAYLDDAPAQLARLAPALEL
ncbi:LLM class flavin-dependent oxidoreductase [Nonomuraea sp. NPDC050783]|uniref:LLM class flavin-dependent oxidoreductase n=1 Tax=Nonomuraea sp. NPDC050783 TaxID=3154634 RepID=UPI003464F179